MTELFWQRNTTQCNINNLKNQCSPMLGAERQALEVQYTEDAYGLDDNRAKISGLCVRN